MKMLIVTESRHCGNTRKIAEAMAEAVSAVITDTAGASQYNLADYDIVGFGSGIYYGKHDKRIIKLIKGFREKTGFSFVFSTSGGGSFEKNNQLLIKLLEEKKKIVLGTFGCKGLDRFFLLKIIGGANKGYPREQDLENARQFILDVVSTYEKENKEFRS